jgi:hypothetical protein
MSDLFVDRLGNVAIADGVVRLDFLRLVSVDPERKQVKMEPSLRVAIPVHAFLQAVDMLDKVHAELLKQVPATGAPAAESPNEPQSR